MRGLVLASAVVILLGLAAQAAAAPPLPRNVGAKQGALQANQAAVIVLPDLKVNRVFVAKWVPPETVTDYQQVSAKISAGTKVFLVCEVTNAGNVAVRGTYEVAFYQGPLLLGTQTITDAPQVGLLRKPAVAWTAIGLGNHVYRCVVDKPDAIKELDGANDLNNVKEMTLNVTPPVTVPTKGPPR